MNGFYIGDIIGNSYTHENEKFNMKTKDFELFTNRSKFSDDTILTFATIEWLLHSNHTSLEMFDIIATYYKKYPDKEPTIYGTAFAKWANAGCKKFRKSRGNGGAMRCSPIAWFANSITMIDDLIEKGISPTHNTKSGKLGAKIVCHSIFYLRTGFGKQELKNKLEKEFKINLNQDINEYRKQYKYTSNAVKTVRPAIISFLNSNSYEDAIRNAVAFGGDTDTITTICSAISEAYYKELPNEIIKKAKTFLPTAFLLLLSEFNNQIKITG